MTLLNSPTDHIRIRKQSSEKLVRFYICSRAYVEQMALNTTVFRLRDSWTSHIYVCVCNQYKKGKKGHVKGR